DDIRVEPFEAAIGAFDQVVIARAASSGFAVFIIGKTNFGDKDDLFAPVAERLGQDLFRVEGAVNFGGVKEGNAVVDGLANRAARFLYVDVAIHRRTHLPGAKTNCRTDQIGVAETSLFHHVPPNIPENKPQSQANQAWAEAIVQRRGA